MTFCPLQRAKLLGKRPALRLSCLRGILKLAGDPSPGALDTWSCPPRTVTLLGHHLLSLAHITSRSPETIAQLPNIAHYRARYLTRSSGTYAQVGGLIK